MKTKHTKGEWFIRGNYITSKNGTIVEHPNINGNENLSFSECEANAKLIASAPELLEALQELTITISQINKHAKDALIERDIKRWEKAEIAIKKATL